MCLKKEDGKIRRCLRIIDNGIGMSLDVIKNHFLNIGSKFRDSNEWKNLREDKQEQNEPVEKNGKFGVGILSSYLLGDNLKVRTCNVVEKVEYDFETERDTQLIEINKKPQSDYYGTTIEIELKDDINIKSLVVGEWYISNDVNLNIKILDEEKKRQKLISLSKKEEGEIWENKFFAGDKMVSSQFNIENYYNQKIMFGKKGYALFNLFFLERLKAFQISGSGIKVVRIWTSKNINITQNTMLDDNIYYIFEGIGFHPSLKYRITNYLKDVPFYTATIYMQKQQLKNYQEYAANAYRLSQKFIESNTIKCFEDNNDFVKEILKLDVKQEDVSLAIVYSCDKISKYNDGSEIFEKYYEKIENVLQTYVEIESCQQELSTT